jgi:sulfur carrier protein
MNLLINGENRECPDVSTIAELIEKLGLPGPTLLIEHNGLALRRDEWANRAIGGGDRLEIMKIAAGG